MSLEVEEGQDERMSSDSDQMNKGIEVPPVLSDSIQSCGTNGSMESFQDMRSLLLCPAQWTALLESPVSLVRHATDSADEQDTSKSDHDESRTIKNSPTHTLERSNGCKPRRPDSPIQTGNQVSSSSHFTLSEVATALASRMEAISWDEDTTNNRLEEISEEVFEDHIDDDDCTTSEEFSDGKSLKSSIEDKRSEDSSSGLNLSHILPMHYSTGFSTEGSCTVSGPSDSPLRGFETPSMGEKSSVPPTPSSESRLSFSLVPSHMSHSRNISETPSLPPFINSSTSSAYHSRNSSLASQITSEWFDSDSHSADIDSCIVMHSGDLQRPISLQDSKFKLPDFTSVDPKNRQCYSFTDLRSPLQVPDSVFLPAPELEDTLCTSNTVNEEDNVNGESFEQKHLATALKSSEWIKKEMRRARSSMVQVKVSSKTRHVVHFNVKAGDMFIWEFATKRKDIGFGLQFEPTEVATSEQSQEEPSESTPEKKMVAILPTLRVNSYAHPTVGSHTATQDGVYEILFDNSYSRFFAKELFYRITTNPAIPNEHYLHQ